MSPWNSTRHYEQQVHKITPWLVLTVDRSANAAYLHLNGGDVSYTKQTGRVNIDFDEDGDIVGIEILTLDLASELTRGC